ncbi:MAG: hypothetical protein V1857_04970 [archaeon]
MAEKLIPTVVHSARFEQGDWLRKGFNVGFGKAKGWLVLSDRKVFFVEESGRFLGKKYNVILDIPYAKIEKIAAEGFKAITVTETEGRSHTFDCEGESTIIQKALQQQMTAKKT